jgi:hypothetical protein
MIDILNREKGQTQVLRISIKVTPQRKVKTDSLIGLTLKI